MGGVNYRIPKYDFYDLSIKTNHPFNFETSASLASGINSYSTLFYDLNLLTQANQDLSFEVNLPQDVYVTLVLK